MVTSGARNMLSLAMARDTVLLTNMCGGMLQYRVPCLIIHCYNKICSIHYFGYPTLPPVSNTGSVILVGCDLCAGVLGDGVGARPEDGVVRYVQEHAVTRGLHKMG